MTVHPLRTGADLLLIAALAFAATVALLPAHLIARHDTRRPR